MLTSAQCKTKLQQARDLLTQVDALLAEVQLQVEEEGYYDSTDYSGDVLQAAREDIATLETQCNAF